MANVIKHKRGSGSDPGASDLVVGEVAIRTDVGKLFTKMDNGSVAEIAGGGSDIAINTLSSSSATGGGSATFNGSAYRFTLSAPPSVSAQQLLVSINGVIQKPVAGTGQPSEGFSVDGTDIILGDAPATGADFFILTFKSLGVSEPADNSVTSAKIADGAIVNADINASAAIAGTKISPDFGSQNIVTTGDLTIDTNTLKVDSSNNRVGIGTASPDTKLEINGGADAIAKVTGTTTAARLDLKTNSHHRFIQLLESGGGFRFYDQTNAAERIRIDSSGRVLIGTTAARVESNGFAAPLQVEGTNTATSSVIIARNSANAASSNLIFQKSRGTSTGSNTVINNNDAVGTIIFEGSDGTNTDSLASIIGACDGTPGTNDVPGRLVFSTTADGAASPTERMRIDSSGRVLIGSTTADDAAQMLKVARTSGTARLAIQAANDGSSQLDFADVADADIGRIQYDHNSNYMALFTNNSERMRIDSSGRVGIGTTSPSSRLHISVDSSQTTRTSESTVFIKNTNNSANTCASLHLQASGASSNIYKISTQKHGGGSGAEFHLDKGTNAIMQISGDNGDIKFGVGGTMIGTFTPGLANNTVGLGVEPRNGSIFLSRSNGAALYVNVNTDGSQLATFRRNGNEQGKIIAHSQSVSYETTSDYRLKENEVAISDGITRLKLLKPYRFNFKSNSSETLDGFFAHEAKTVVPECASGTKDEVVVQAQVDSGVYKEEELGNPIYQGIDQSKLVPLLVAALQEAIGRIEALEAG